MPDSESIFPPLPEWFWYPIVFLYGSIVGSFLNVLIYRLPLGKPINGKSYCPNCRHYLKPYHNVPLIAFLLLRGRCAFCKVPISWRYFTVELVTACLWVALYHQVSGISSISWIDFVAQALFASILIAMIFIDLDHFIAPDELNVIGFGLGLGRDLVCLIMAWQAGRYVFDQVAPKYAYFGWLPHAIPGAITYGGVLFLVSLVGFIYYARAEWESVGSAVRRFFTFEDAPPPPEPEPVEDSSSIEAVAPAISTDEEEEAGDPPRIRFSPGFLAFISALFLLTLTLPTPGLWHFASQWGILWASLAFLIPLAGFLLLTRRDGESVGGALRRFFSANDLYEAPSASITPVEEVDAGENQENLLTSEEEANQFIRDAEDGKVGGMGLGDVKLALAIGSMLGPGLSLLSLFFATFTGALTGVIFTRLHGKSLRYAVPFVPFMAVGAIVAMLFGNQMVEWYLIVSGVKKAPEPPPLPPRRARRLHRPPPG
jgi:prepilin signal peptidase PulO-like enzyme (type II secretory pathway)